MTESIVKPVSLIAPGIANFVLKRVICRKKHWKAEMKVSEEIVWVLYY